MKPEELYELDIRDFVDMVNGKLSWEAEVYDARLDLELQHLAHFTASIMLSSGNYKKSTKIDRIKESLYIPIADREKYQKRAMQHAEGRPNRGNLKAPSNKVEELKRRFGLDEKKEEEE